jgi:hypothetical protein
LFEPSAARYPFTQVGLDKLEVRIGLERLDVSSCPGDQVVEGHDGMSVCQEAFT